MNRNYHFNQGMNDTFGKSSPVTRCVNVQRIVTPTPEWVQAERRGTPNQLPQYDFSVKNEDSWKEWIQKNRVPLEPRNPCVGVLPRKGLSPTLPENDDDESSLMDGSIQTWDCTEEELDEFMEEEEEETSEVVIPPTQPGFAVPVVFRIGTPLDESAPAAPLKKQQEIQSAPWNDAQHFEYICQSTFAGTGCAGEDVLFG